MLGHPDPAGVGGDDQIATFTTTDREVARRFRAAWLAGHVINADVLGASFSRAKVCSVKRDPISASRRWSIEVEEAQFDSVRIFAAGLTAHPPILDLNAKKGKVQKYLLVNG